MTPTPAGKDGSTTVGTLAVGLKIFLRFAAAPSAAAISCCSSCRRFSSTERPRCLPAFTAIAGEASCRTAVAPCASAADASDSAAAITHKRQSLAGYEPVAPVAAKDIDARSASFDA